MANVKEAIEAYLDASQENGLPFLSEVGRETVDVEVTAE